MKNNLLSKYVYVFAYDSDQTILYNSLNSSVVLLENKYLDNNFLNLNIEQKNQLDEMGFLLDNLKAYDHILTTYDNCKSDRLSIIIEVTQKCNLQCIYCYQENWNKEDEISFETIDKITEYIKNCILSENYKKLDVNFIGGEPLIAKNRMLLIYENLKAICKELNVSLEIDIDTNGVLLTKEFIENFDSANISVSLTMKKDHNEKRITKDNKGTYDIIIDNLISCKAIFNLNNKYKLSIRYNTDYENKA